MTTTATQPETKSFDVTFECLATNAGRMRTDMTATMTAPDQQSFSLATDEGKFHGGDGSAPPPLALFAGGLASCLVTQLRAFSKRLRIPAGEITVTARLHWRGHQTGRDPYTTEPVGFELDIDLNSDAPVEDQLALIEAAKKGCFIEQTLARENHIAHRLRAGSDWITA